MIKLIIFDWDDVFTIGSKEGYFACYRKALDVVGVTLPEKEFRNRIVQLWGQSARREMENLLREHPQLVDKAIEVYINALLGETFTHEITLLPGSIDLLLRLQKKYILALATGIDPHNLKKIITKFSVPDVFSEIIFSSDLTDPMNAKPNGFMVEQILKRTHVNATEAVMVGDAANDMLMGKNGGVLLVAVLSGHLTRREAEELGVHHIIEDVTKLEIVLGELNNKSI